MHFYHLGLNMSYCLLTAWCTVLLEKLTGLQLVKKFPAFHSTRRFITALTSVRQLSLSWTSPIQSIYPHPTFWRSILILSTHLRLGLPSGLFPSGFPTKTLYTTLSSPIHSQPISFLSIAYIWLLATYAGYVSEACISLKMPMIYGRKFYEQEIDNKCARSWKWEFVYTVHWSLCIQCTEVCVYSALKFVYTVYWSLCIQCTEVCVYSALKFVYTVHWSFRRNCLLRRHLP